MLGKSTPNLQIRERPGPPDPEIKEGGRGWPPQKKNSALGASVWSKVMVVGGEGGVRPGGGGVRPGPPGSATGYY